jgi:hypothetical protein
MWARLKDRINRLKSTSRQRSRRRKNEREELRYAYQRIARLRAQNEALRARLTPTRVKQHRYPGELMALSVFLVVQGGSSLRCAAAGVEFVSQLLGWSFPQPSHTTVREWVLRCGYQAVLDSRALSGRFALIIDESIQVGKEKLLLLLGVELAADQCRCAPLQHRDVHVLGLEVQSSWTGQDIADFVHSNLQQRPALQVAYLISDCGSSIRAALRRLGLPWVSDCTHLMMNLVKQIFSQDAALSRFSAQLGALRRDLTLAKWNGLLPARLRDKDRFLRIFTIVDWVERMDAYWQRLPAEGRAHIAFYRQARTLVNRLRQVSDLVRIAAQILKTAGLSPHSHSRWQDAVQAYRAEHTVLSQAARRFIPGVNAYFDQHLQHWAGEDQRLCCSDIIESTFGRYKNKGGMKAISADVLSIALYNRKLTPSFVKTALESVSGQQLLEWEAKHVCHNRFGLRKRLDAELKTDRSDE